MKSDSKNAQPGRWTLSLALLTAVIGTALSLFLYSRIAQTEKTEARLKAEALQARTETELNRFAEVLESVRALHALSGEINQAAMSEFIEKGLVHQQTVLGAFGLAQKINPPMRSEIEQKPKGRPGAYNVVQRGSDGTWTPSPNRPFYYPLTWQSHTNALNIPVGYDFASTDSNRRAIAKIEQTRRTALSIAPVPFAGKNTRAYWVFAPVLSRQNTRTVIGFAVAILSPEIILQRIVDPSAQPAALRLEPVSPSTTQWKQTIRKTEKSWLYQATIRALGADWLFTSRTPFSTSGRRSAAALTAGLTITALMTALLLLLAGRTRKIEANVLTRTEELRLANQQLEQNMKERAQMEEEMNELAAREKRRIGRDLHDSLGQKLTGAVFLSRSLLDWFETHRAESEKPAAPVAQTDHARTLNETLKSAVSQVRNMARGLASVTLNEESIEESLHQLAEEMSSLYKTPCELTQTGQLPPLNRKTKEQLYFIAREAVNNAARHANATRITVKLAGEENGWSLCIADDGDGMPQTPSGGSRVDPEQSRRTPRPGGRGAPLPNPTSPEGMGLRIMHHRAARIGAKLFIQSSPGKGTIITVQSATHP